MTILIHPRVMPHIAQEICRRIGRVLEMHWRSGRFVRFAR